MSLSDLSVRVCVSPATPRPHSAEVPSWSRTLWNHGPSSTPDAPALDDDASWLQSTRPRPAVSHKNLPIPSRPVLSYPIPGQPCTALPVLTSLLLAAPAHLTSPSPRAEPCSTSIFASFLDCCAIRTIILVQAPESFDGSWPSSTHPRACIQRVRASIKSPATRPGAWLRLSRLHLFVLLLARSLACSFFSLEGAPTWLHLSRPSLPRLGNLLCPFVAHGLPTVLLCLKAPSRTSALNMVRVPRWPAWRRAAAASLLFTTSPLVAAYDLDPNSTGTILQSPASPCRPG